MTTKFICSYFNDVCTADLDSVKFAKMKNFFLIFVHQFVQHVNLHQSILNHARSKMLMQLISIHYFKIN